MFGVLFFNGEYDLEKPVFFFKIECNNGLYDPLGHLRGENLAILEPYVTVF